MFSNSIKKLCNVLFVIQFLHNSSLYHNSLSGCPLAAMEKMSHKDKLCSICPKSMSTSSVSSPSASISPSPPSVQISSDRVLRPMCFVKQLDLPGQYSSGQSASYATPRTNLAKELEKYSKPQLNTDCQYSNAGISSTNTTYCRPLMAKSCKLINNDNASNVSPYRDRLPNSPHQTYK